MKTYFEFSKHNTDYKKETLAGITTFLAMAYIIVVNPAILEAAGIPKGPSMTATILAAAFGSLLMGLYANRPFAVAAFVTIVLMIFTTPTSKFFTTQTFVAISPGYPYNKERNKT